MEPFLFAHLMQPYGGLNQHRETHALFYYYMLAQKNFEEQQNMIVYEGDADPVFDYYRLFVSIAAMYNVEPEAMAKCWKEVDYTCAAQGLPKLKDERRYRHDFKPEEV